MKTMKNVPRETKGKGKKAPSLPRAEDLLQEIGQAFMIKRTKLRMNYQDVAEKCGVSTLTISNLEKGNLKNASLDILDKIGTALEIRLSIELEDI